MATKSSLTFVAVFALVSMKKMPLSFEYVSASSGSTLRFELRSDLLPASAITMLGLPCRCSSFTHCLARWNVSCGGCAPGRVSSMAVRRGGRRLGGARGTERRSAAGAPCS